MVTDAIPTAIPSGITKLIWPEETKEIHSNVQHRRCLSLLRSRHPMTEAEAARWNSPLNLLSLFRRRRRSLPVQEAVCCWPPTQPEECRLLSIRSTGPSSRVGCSRYRHSQSAPIRRRKAETDCVATGNRYSHGPEPELGCMPGRRRQDTYHDYPRTRPDVNAVATGRAADEFQRHA